MNYLAKYFGDKINEKREAYSHTTRGFLLYFSPKDEARLFFALYRILEWKWYN